jgi:hypothetical protein
MILWAAGSNGPRALPGDYSVRLRVDNQAPLTQPFRLSMDPRAPHVTMADLAIGRRRRMKAWSASAT